MGLPQVGVRLRHVLPGPGGALLAQAWGFLAHSGPHPLGGCVCLSSVLLCLLCFALPRIDLEGMAHPEVFWAFPQHRSAPHTILEGSVRAENLHSTTGDLTLTLL